jgi:leader peptidase (prepilin peptidase)/N-methyltransferase
MNYPSFLTPVVASVVEATSPNTHIERVLNLLSQPSPQNLWVLLVIVLGLIIGSFLNVVIYRGSAKYQGTNYKGKLTISEPKGSFCPNCLTPLKWTENIPLLSWIAQKGKCKHCNAPISAQYPLVEALNAATWVALYMYSPTMGEFMVYAITSSLLIAAAGIDIKTAKIPNNLTLWGTVTVLILGSLLVIGSTQERILGIATGFGTMFVIVQLGKLLFGQRHVKMKELVPFKWDMEHKKLTIKDEGKSLEESEAIEAHELFTRRSDYIEILADIKCKNNPNKSTREKIQIRLNKTYFFQEGEKIEAGENSIIEGKIKSISFPREAMGMGDAKLMALVGASLGAIPTLYAILIAACAGALVGIGLRLIKAIKKGNPPETMVFGPWLAAAAIAMMFICCKN